MWLRVLYFDIWFRIILFCVVVGGIAIVVSLPKFWLVTPPGFTPIARVSLLDRLQAARARRSFLAAAQSGQIDLAMLYVKQSLTYNPGDAAAVRQALGWFAQHPPEKPGIAAAIPNMASYLLRLGGTNSADAELVGLAVAPLEDDETAFNTLYPIWRKLDAAGRVRLLRACLFSRRWQEFDELESVPSEASPEAVLLRHVRAAVLVGPPASKGCEDEVKKSRSVLPSDTIYTRLLLVASLAAMDPDLCRETIDRLRDLHALRVDDEAKYWRLIFATGKEDAARQMVRARLEAGTNPAEAEDLAQAAVELGLSSEAVDFLGRILASRPELATLALLKADILLGQARWKDLNEQALALRGFQSSSGLADISYLFESASEAAQGRAITAREALRRADPSRITGPRFVIECARVLATNGLAPETLEFLKAEKKVCQNQSTYWSAIISAAQGAVDLDTLLSAAREAHDRWPSRPEFMGVLATALLTARQDIPTALQLSRSLHLAQPKSKAWHLGYVYALVQSEKWAEAKAELSLIEGPFDPPQIAALDGLIRFELEWRTGDPARAEKIAGTIITNNLPPTSIAWLADARKKIRQAKGG